jgi:GNAT superfamily N-acetyltransferase
MAMRTSGTRFRPLTGADVETVAQLHAASWRIAYRGILGDDFLDGDLLADRVAVWQAKLGAGEAGLGWLALVDDAPTGFVYIRPGDDAHWGTLVDNLHVLPGHQGQGIGRQLLQLTGAWCAQEAANAGVYLWVFRDNVRARGFYARVGGHEAELVQQPASDGRVLPEYRVVWETGAALRRFASA